MDSGRFTRLALTSAGLCWGMLSLAGSVQAVPFLEFVDPNPASGNLFGYTVLPLSTGNVVVTSPLDDAGGTDAGAVYLFNGATGALISTLLGSSAGDVIGAGGVTALTNGNYVIRSFNWSSGGNPNVGAVTWGSGTTGVSGVVSAANSLVGSTGDDNLGGDDVTVLPNGNYVVRCPGWDDGAILDAGAVTWGSGTSGVSGVISAANSLVGSGASNAIGLDGVTALSNGNYVVRSRLWGGADVGAVTWGSGTTGVTGVVSAANSLVGSTVGDRVGSTGVIALPSGNYLVLSPAWNNGGIVDAGAVTWCSGTTGVSGPVSAANSLVGSTSSDLVGFIVVGGIGSGVGVSVLSNGNYVVSSPRWNRGGISDAGAATWGSGTSGVFGAVSAANSLVGSKTSDLVANAVVTALSNGNYVVVSPSWDDDAVGNVGAVTWCDGTSGGIGEVSADNSLVGTNLDDFVGSGGVTALSNGNYVVPSPSWDDGSILNAGAATWGDGTTGVTGAVSAGNSLVGSTSNDQVGIGGVTALTNGNYVVRSTQWDNGAIGSAGAATWGDGTTGVSGPVSAANSLVGSSASDQVGSRGVTTLTNGNYVVASPLWDNGAIGGAGAATWGSGTTGVTGPVSAANSLVGSTANDQVGSGGVTALSDGNYVVCSPRWDDDTAIDVGAATWGDGTTGVTGLPLDAMSLMGSQSNTSLEPIVEDAVNGTFYGSFVTDGGGRVRVGPQGDFAPVIVSVVDVPDDQGFVLTLTFDRSSQDAPDAPSPPAASYAILRRVQGTIAAGARRPPSARAPAALPARAFPGVGTWEQVGSVPATQQAQYVVQVPTTTNSNPTEFLVAVQLTAPSIRTWSVRASGTSVDNLFPAEPTGLSAEYSNGQTNLTWAANTELDLANYRVYRGSSADFTPSPFNRIASPDTTVYADVGRAGSFYKVSAVDINGNESSPALITPQQTTDVGDGIPAAVAFALEGVHPNPARGNGLHVGFALPSAAPARLELLDVSGRRVKARDVGALGAGRHVVNLAEGGRVPPGLYWVRLVQGANRRTTRLAVIE